MNMLFLYIISDVYMIAFLLLFCKVRERAEETALVVAGLALCDLVIELLRSRLEELGCVTNWVFFLILITGVVAAVEISEYGDDRAVLTALMAGCYSMFGDHAAVLAGLMGANLFGRILAEVVVLTAVFAVLVKFMRPIYMRIQKLYRGEWRKFCVLVVMYLICEFLIMVNESQASYSLHKLLPMIHLMLGFFTVFFLYALFDRMLRDEGKLQQQKVWNAGIVGLQKNVEEIRHAEQRIAAYNHDSRHMIRMISGMMSDQDYEGIEQALIQLGTMPLSTEKTVYCRNYPVNSVVSYLAEQMEYQHIVFHANLGDMDEMIDGWIANDMQAKPVAETDSKAGKMKQSWEENLIDSDLADHERVDGDWELAVVLSGLLRDAMEVCLWDRKQSAETETERHWVIVTTRCDDQCLNLEVRNACKTPIPFDDSTKLPLFPWKKHDELGLPTIEAFTAWRGGTMECGQEQEQYYVRIRMEKEEEPG